MNGFEKHADEMLSLMGKVGDRLPADWQPGLWLGSAWNLAEVVVQLRGRLPEQQIVALLGVGGMMLRQAKIETNATSIADMLRSGHRPTGGAA